VITGLEFDTPILGTVRMGETRPGLGGAEDYLVHFDYFEVHNRERNADGSWAKHPIHDKLHNRLKLDGHAGTATGELKLREIPITLPYNNPKLLLTQQLEARSLVDGRRVCVGNGESAVRLESDQRTVATACPGCERCPFGNTQEVQCQRRTSLIFRIEGQDDPFSVFVLHSAGRNTAQTLVTKVHSMHAAFGNRLTGIPMTLKMRNTVSADSDNSSVFYADLVLRDINPNEAVKVAMEYERQQKEAGFDQGAMEEALLQLKAQSQFAPPEDFGQVQDFYGRRRAASRGEHASQSLQLVAVNADGHTSEAVAGGDQPIADLEAAPPLPPPKGGARFRMRKAVQAATSVTSLNERLAPSAELSAKGAESNLKSEMLHLVAPADADVPTPVPMVPSVRGCALGRVTAASLAGIPEMPRAVAGGTGF
jgi:hypothetical protein